MLYLILENRTIYGKNIWWNIIEIFNFNLLFRLFFVCGNYINNMWRVIGIQVAQGIQWSLESVLDTLLWHIFWNTSIRKHKHSSHKSKGKLIRTTNCCNLSRNNMLRWTFRREAAGITTWSCKFLCNKCHVASCGKLIQRVEATCTPFALH